MLKLLNTKLFNHKINPAINPNLIGLLKNYNLNYQIYRYEHTLSNSKLLKNKIDTNANNSFNIKKIIEEELKANNYNKNNFEPENKIKNIDLIKIDKIKELYSSNLTNSTITPNSTITSNSINSINSIDLIDSSKQNLVPVNQKLSEEGKLKILNFNPIIMSRVIFEFMICYITGYAIGYAIVISVI